MSQKVYEKYKPSDAEWMGEVPDHWDVKAIKWATPVFRGASPRPIDDPNYFDDDGEYAWVRIADVTASGMYLTETTQRLSDLGDASSVRIKPGALFLSIAGTVGKPCIAGIKCCIHDGFVYFPDWRGNIKFLFYIFASGAPYQGLGKFGTQLNLNTDTVGSIRIGIPPLLEQQAIANFLDAKTAVLDQLTAKKRELLERLREQRTAIISRMVTKGLPDVEARAAGVDVISRFKPSGVEWLGDVPEHWEITRLGFLVQKIGSGKTPKGGAEFYQSEGVMLIRSQNVHDDGLRLADIFYIDAETDDEMSGTRVRPNDVLLNITGASLGRCCIVPPEFPPANVNQHVCIIRLVSSVAIPEFIQRVLTSLSIQTQIFASENGSSREGLNFVQIRNFGLVLPPILEQRAIADYLDRETTRIDHLISRVQTALETLGEYRAALITAAVTGRIDVREAVTG